jgi:hypothetical protein
MRRTPPSATHQTIKPLQQQLATHLRAHSKHSIVDAVKHLEDHLGFAPGLLPVAEYAEESLKRNSKDTPQIQALILETVHWSYMHDITRRYQYTGDHMPYIPHT